MAATYQAPPLIGVTAPDEDMDLLSDNGRMDQDQDLLDVDGPVPRNSDEDFDFTLEDAASDGGVPLTHEDDEMIDDYAQADDFTQEDTMHDAFQPEDELLDDASEHDDGLNVEESTYDFTGHGELRDDTFVTAIEEHTEQGLPTVHLNNDQHFNLDQRYITDKIDYVDELVPSTQNRTTAAGDVPAQDTDLATTASTATAELKPEDAANTDAERHFTTIAQEAEYSGTSTDRIVQIQSNTSELADSTTDMHAQTNNAEDAAALLDPTPFADDVQHGDLLPPSTEVLASIPENTSALSQHPDESDAASAPEVPTILVDYYGDEYSLFPPSQNYSDLIEFADYSYLLDSVTCFHKSIHDMLNECKHMLSTDIGEDQELELEVPALGLTITESSRDSHDHTMEEILTVFHTLNANDGLQEMQPLWITLKTRTKFTARLAALQQAVNEQKGMSELAHLLFAEDDAERGSHEDSEALAPDDSEDSHEDPTVVFAEAEGEYDNNEEAQAEGDGAEAFADVVEHEHSEEHDWTHVTNGDFNGEVQHAEESSPEHKSIHEQLEDFGQPEEQIDDTNSSSTSVTLKEDEATTAPQAVEQSGVGAQPSGEESIIQHDLAAGDSLDLSNLAHKTSGELEEQIPATMAEHVDATADDHGPGKNQSIGDETSPLQEEPQTTSTTGGPNDEVKDAGFDARPDSTEVPVFEGTDLVEDADEPSTFNPPDQAPGQGLYLFDEDDKITFGEEDEEPPSKSAQAASEMTSPNADPDSAASQVGRKRSWEEHLDEDLLDDEISDSPKRAKHAEGANQ